MSNQFTFTCPIFNVETKMAACGKLMEQVWMGRRIEVRKGCQACMASSKCPMVMIARIRTNSRDYGNMRYFSAEPKHGKLEAEVLERIRPIVVMDHHLTQKGATPTEIALIQSANARIDQQLGHAPRAEHKPSRPVAQSRPKAAAISAIDPSIAEAARTGDLAAALNQ